MQILKTTKFLNKRAKPLVLTIGNFDGVHLAHQALLDAVVTTARKLGGIPGAITFVPHPLKVLLKNPDIKLLTTLKDRAALINKSGIELLFRLRFDDALARTSSHDFVTSVLYGELRISALVVGHDYCLGRNKEGNLAFLQEIGSKLGFDVIEVPRQKMNGIIVSSTKVRECLLNGDIRLASRLLGRPYSITGTVHRCSGRGHGLGFPTANLVGIETLLPQNGVYITRSHVSGRTFHSVTNIGRHPTFFSEAPSVETHILDHQIDLYGKSIKIAFLKRTRAEHRYSSREELIRQICSDVDTAREFFHLQEQERLESSSRPEKRRVKV